MTEASPNPTDGAVGAARARIADALRESILSGAIAPGEWIRQRRDTTDAERQRGVHIRRTRIELQRHPDVVAPGGRM